MNDVLDRCVRCGKTKQPEERASPLCTECLSMPWWKRLWTLWFRDGSRPS